ncbi:MAG: HAMP domain-containing sensor histidine kinase [Bryobacteraceae bacterium]
MQQSAFDFLRELEWTVRNEPAQGTPELLRNLSHELRQPLSAIESIAFYLQMAIPGSPAKSHQHLARIPELVDSMNGVLSDVVHYMGLIPPQVQHADLQVLVAEVAVDLFTEQRPHLVVDLAANTIPVSIDCPQGRHLVRTLASFFRQIGKPLDEVRLRASAANGEARLDFHAPGIEYSPDELDAMFEPFHPDLPQGCALSLVTARKIAEGHGGRVGIRSEAGTGTTMTVYLPLG